MNLYIQIENGQPINHPAFEDNLIDAFNEVPATWEPFVRIELPILEENQIFNDPKVTYEKVNGVWTDVFHIRDIDDETKTILKQKKINAYKTMWNALPQRDNFSAWVFNEDTIRYEPPIPRPTDRDVYWQGKTNSWVDRPPKPDDGKEYRIDFDTGTWVEVTE